MSLAFRLGDGPQRGSALPEHWEAGRRQGAVRLSRSREAGRRLCQPRASDTWLCVEAPAAAGLLGPWALPAAAVRVASPRGASWAPVTVQADAASERCPTSRNHCGPVGGPEQLSLWEPHSFSPCTIITGGMVVRQCRHVG